MASNEKIEVCKKLAREMGEQYGWRHAEHFNVLKVASDITPLAGVAFDVMRAEGYRKVSADPDTVERAAEAIGGVSLKYGGPGWGGADDEQREALRDMARAAINAIGGGDG